MELLNILDYSTNKKEEIGMTAKKTQPLKKAQPEPEKKMTGTDAIELLRREEAARRQGCWTAIQQALTNWGFTIGVTTLLTSDNKVKHLLNLINITRQG